MNGIPETIGRYEVERLLGQGAMGSVYLGRDPELDRAVAIKTVKHLDLEEERLGIFLERFKNEAKAAARLSHPAIVAVYDVGEDDDVGPYMVCEYVAGSTLKQIVRGRGPLAADAVVKLGRQVAAAIDTAHAAGVIHRDIKPDNILVSAAGDAKLADFGIARLPDAALTKEGQFLGTPCYAAPETLEKGKYGPHSDIFSFAAVLYEAITGLRAFPGDDAISVAHHVVHDEPQGLSAAAPDLELPKEIERVVMRGLSKAMGERPASAMALVDALSAAYVETGILDHDPTGLQVLPPNDTAARHREGSSSWAFTAVLVILAALGIGLGWWFVEHGVDSGPLDPVPMTAPDAAVDAGSTLDLVVPDAGSDGGPDAGPPAGPVGPDAGPSDLPLLASMSAFERDEAAKDAVDEVEEALANDDLPAAAAALRLARHYDPGNSDIPELEARLARALEED